MATRILITSDRYGTGDDELGRVLMKNFLYSLARTSPKPSAVMLANSGVNLACRGSASLDDLRLLVADGVAVRACGTCLDYYGLTDALVVGEMGTMPQSVEALMSSDKIVTIG